MAQKNKLNLNSFNLLKGFVIICVVLSHTLATYKFDGSNASSLVALHFFLTLVGPFLMPALFIVSGYGFKEREPMKCLKKTAEGMLVPYFWIALAYATITPLLYVLCGESLAERQSRILGYLAAYLFGLSKYGVDLGWIQAREISASWFFLASFVALNVLNLILKLKNLWAQIGCVGLCLAAGIVLDKLGFIYFCVPQGLVSVAFCYIGYTIKKYKLFDWFNAKPYVLVLLFLAAAAEYYWGLFTLSRFKFNNALLDCIGAGCGGILIVIAGIYLGKFDWKATDWLKQVGVYSYWVLAIHCFEMDGVPWNFIQRAPAHPFPLFCLEVAVKAAELIAVCYCLKQLSKYRYRRRIAKNAAQKIS